MEKILCLLVILVMTSCVSKSDNASKSDSVNEEMDLKDVASKRLKIAINEYAPHSFDSQPEISKQEELLNNDSIYIISFKMKYKNKYNGYSNDEFNYAYVLNRGIAREALVNISEFHNRSYIMSIAELFNVAVENGKEPHDMNEFASMAASMYVLAYGNTID